MPLTIVDASLSNFDAEFKKLEDSDNQIKFLLFLAEKDPVTSLSWCPDCNVAEPVIYKKLGESEGDVLLLRVDVGDKPTWRNPSHPWRVDSTFKLSGVPTLIRWKDGIAGRLEDHEAHVEAEIDALLDL